MIYNLYNRSVNNQKKEFSNTKFVTYKTCTEKIRRFCPDCYTIIEGIWNYQKIYHKTYKRFNGQRNWLGGVSTHNSLEDAQSNMYEQEIDECYKETFFDDPNDCGWFFLSKSTLLSALKKEKISYKISHDGTHYECTDKKIPRQIKKIYASAEYARLCEIKQEIETLKTMWRCPLCSGKLSQVLNSNDYNATIEALAEANASERFERFKKENEPSPLSPLVLGQKLSTENLIEYLFHSLNIENGIFSVEKRLKELYKECDIAKKESCSSEQIYLKQLYQKIKIASDKYTTYLNESNPTKTFSINEIPINYPQKPIAPQKPSEPTLEKPGFFNKKKISEQNAALMKNYEEELRAYQLSEEKYRHDLSQYNHTVDSLQAEQKRIFDRMFAEKTAIYQKSLASLRTSLDAANARFDKANDSPDLIITPSKGRYELLRSEILQAEALLTKLYVARNKIFSKNIIFEKYRDIVSISTFYEYLRSGRCESLDGPTGAYNLYENEIQMKTIISRLDTVVETLNEIRENQYIIYSSIQETNRQLTELNQTMRGAVNTLEELKSDASDMKSYMEDISKDTKIIAHNTAVTAYYAKKNAELTNALGYLVALN